MTETVNEIFYPEIGFRQGAPRSKVFGLIAGDSGVGKSHTVRQIALDARFKDAGVAVLMAEDATATYGDAVPDRHLFPCRTVATAAAHMTEFVRAAKRGLKVPGVCFVDSLSGIVDYQMQEYKRNPIVSERTNNRDKYAEFGDLGEQVRDFALMCRDDAPMDVIWLVTTCGTPPEYAVSGKVIPTNLTRWTSFTLYMKAREDAAEVDKIVAAGEKAEAPHRTIGRNELGAPTGAVINRFFLTMNNGEVQAKGHRNLAMIERAYLPDVLMKVKGV